MSRDRAFQNPYLDRKLSRKNIVPLQKEKNELRSREIGVIAEVERTLNPETGRARYSSDGTLCCIQMVDMLPWWRRLLISFEKNPAAVKTLVGDYCEIDGVKYLKVGQTNILYRAQEWIADRTGKSSLRIV